jgi:hypothetical protein
VVIVSVVPGRQIVTLAKKMSGSVLANTPAGAAFRVGQVKGLE